ncbi:hypothetical protein Goshw_005912 [Gossypium schwendimanii]|uniref:Uncharacterized protein n=1 Tax=Gossypium schwendimanii TaxID=34291 RepID=A0A7J9LE52_GOSSC|nr:hypothetical protein [Gossypium schwendimanii]
MTLQVLSRSPPVRHKRQCSPDDLKTERKGRNYGGMVGGSAAECTAVCCCFPLTIMELLVLGLYKVPTGLCKKACRRKKGKHKSHGFHPTSSSEDQDTELHQMVGNADDGSRVTVDSEDKKSDRFFGTGFWRDPSEKETHDLTLMDYHPILMRNGLRLCLRHCYYEDASANLKQQRRPNNPTPIQAAGNDLKGIPKRLTPRLKGTERLSS